MAPSDEDGTTTTRINARLNLWNNRTELDAMLSEYSLSLNDHEVSPIQESEQTKPAQREIDDLLSKELLKLSMQDRNAIVEEIHGVQTIAPRETPLMIQSALREFAVHVDQMPIDQKAAFLRSQELYPHSYINEKDFRLRFLRCDLFDTKKAAIRFVEFLDLVSDLFGDYVLRRPIQITDFTWEEMQAMRHGYLQLLPYRDRSGRRIFAFVGGMAMSIPLTTKVSLYRGLSIFIPSSQHNKSPSNPRHIIHNLNKIGQDSYLHAALGIRGRRITKDGHHLDCIARGQVLGRTRTKWSRKDSHYFYETNVLLFTNSNECHPFLFALISVCQYFSNNIFLDHATSQKPNEIPHRYVFVCVWKIRS